MIKPINKNKVQIKLLLNIQHHFEDYPTDEDFLFDLVKVLFEINKINDFWTIPEVHPLMNKLPKGGSHSKIINNLISKGFIEKTKIENKQHFKIKKHLWE
jgi:hypothetical protein